MNSRPTMLGGFFIFMVSKLTIPILKQC